MNPLFASMSPAQMTLAKLAIVGFLLGLVWGRFVRSGRVSDARVLFWIIAAGGFIPATWNLLVIYYLL